MELQHDPRTKQQIKELLYDLLYRPILQSYQKQLKNIILKNCQLQKSTHESMMYRGEVYVSMDCTTAPPRMVSPLHAQLKPEMDEYLKELSSLNSHELPYVLGYINQVLNSSNNLPDYLRLFPDSVHQPLLKLISYACRNPDLTDEDVETLRTRNAVPIELMKQRLVLNLLL